MSRFLAPAIISLLAFGITVLPAQEKSGITEQQFRRITVTFLEDPLGEKAKDMAKAIIVFTMETPDAAVVMGKEELKWIGEDKERGMLLLAAYMAGNTQAQLHSGIKRNDRYSGLLHLFQVYRTLKKNEEKFAIAEVEELLKMHRDDKLLPHLLALEEKMPTKLSKEDEEALKKLKKEMK